MAMIEAAVKKVLAAHGQAPTRGTGKNSSIGSGTGGVGYVGCV